MVARALASGSEARERLALRPKGQRARSEQKRARREEGVAEPREARGKGRPDDGSTPGRAARQRRKPLREHRKSLADAGPREEAGRGRSGGGRERKRKPRCHDKVQRDRGFQRAAKGERGVEVRQAWGEWSARRCGKDGCRNCRCRERTEAHKRRAGAERGWEGGWVSIGGEGWKREAGSGDGQEHTTGGKGREEGHRKGGPVGVWLCPPMRKGTWVGVNEGGEVDEGELLGISDVRTRDSGTASGGRGERTKCAMP